MANKHSNGGGGISRRSLLRGAGALTAAGWVAGFSGGWILRPSRAFGAAPIKFGVATDITGAIAPSGNSNWQVIQLAAKKINDAGGIGGRPIELYLEDTASDPKVAVGNVLKLIQQHKVDVVVGGITSAMREAIKNPIVRRGKTLYLYPQLYEGQECTEHLYCTGPTPAQQCDELIPYLMNTLGKKRFAMPSANYRWPQLLNKYARALIEKNGGEVVFEEYYPLDQLEYSATVAKIKSEGVDCVFNTVIPPGLQAFTKQLYESGFQKDGGAHTCVYFDENSVNYVPERELEGVFTCLDYFHTVDDPVGAQLQKEYAEMFPGTKYLFTAGSAATGAYRAVKFYEAAVKKTGGDLSREAVSAAIDDVAITDVPGGDSRMVPGTGHCALNMYVAQAKGGSYEILSSANMVAPQECG
ncbi:MULTISPECIES: substrate-binding protein [unclassified Minwuia]|jgi:urea transport system substrate-binding protein|uniref:substrate-binding protein n=1 Tax=unclassified Minwuia TaxID=2618799 RepID=UPI0024792A40|nr:MULTISPECIES: substrate-binding protein [unclassified Minwuia]